MMKTTFGTMATTCFAVATFTTGTPICTVALLAGFGCVASLFLELGYDLYTLIRK